MYVYTSYEYLVMFNNRICNFYAKNNLLTKLFFNFSTLLLIDLLSEFIASVYFVCYLVWSLVLGGHN